MTTGNGQGPDSRFLRVRCPVCSAIVALETDTPWDSIRCHECKTKIELSNGRPMRASFAEKIGPFEPVSRLGMGSFGTVWRCFDRELDRYVAVKIPRMQDVSSEQIEKFLREARAVAQILHPNVVRVYEIGRCEAGVFIASEYIEGLSLIDWCEKNSPNHHQIVQMLMKIVEAISFVHSAGVIHRDLKPDNIIVDAKNEPHVLDFGLARRLAGEITMTCDGEIMGTPAFMSPEQAKGDSHTSDSRSDIYSLGVVLFQMLTGELPFQGDPVSIIYKVIHEMPVGARSIDRRIPNDLEYIVSKCMQKEPCQRYPSAEDLSSDLALWLCGEPVVSHFRVGLKRKINNVFRGKWKRLARLLLWGPIVLVLIAAMVVTVISNGIWNPIDSLKENSNEHQEYLKEYNRDAARRE